MCTQMNYTHLIFQFSPPFLLRFNPYYVSNNVDINSYHKHNTLHTNIETTCIYTDMYTRHTHVHKTHTCTQNTHTHTTHTHTTHTYTHTTRTHKHIDITCMYTRHKHINYTEGENLGKSLLMKQMAWKNLLEGLQLFHSNYRYWRGKVD